MLMSTRRIISLLLVILAAAGLAGCQKAEPSPTVTPDQASFQAASTLFAQPTRSTRPTTTPTPVNEVELDLSRSIAQMEKAVLAQDYDGYMAYVWKGDPVFRTDHAKWAHDWVEHPLSAFDITLNGIRALSPTSATARMTIIWSQSDSTSEGSAGGTTISAVFYREGDIWQFGGESWQTFKTDGITFYYFANELLDNQMQADAVTEYLPAVYSQVTREFDYVPEHTAHVKMFENVITLQTMTRLSIPRMTYWNEPGESIKVTLGPSNTPPDDDFIAREYTRFVLYEMNGGSHGDFPWWLEEGIAEYGGSLFRTLSQRNRIVKQVAALTFAGDNDELHLIDWADLASQPDPADSAYQFAGPQAFTLLQYITVTYGRDARNAWIKAVVAGQTVDEAAQAELGASFEQIDADWRAWLPDQL